MITETDRINIGAKNRAWMILEMNCLSIGIKGVVFRMLNLKISNDLGRLVRELSDFKHHQIEEILKILE